MGYFCRGRYFDHNRKSESYFKFSCEKSQDFSDLVAPSWSSFYQFHINLVLVWLLKPFTVWNRPVREIYLVANCISNLAALLRFYAKAQNYVFSWIIVINALRWNRKGEKSVVDAAPRQIFSGDITKEPRMLALKRRISHQKAVYFAINTSTFAEK